MTSLKPLSSSFQRGAYHPGWCQGCQEVRGKEGWGPSSKLGWELGSLLQGSQLCSQGARGCMCEKRRDVGLAVPHFPPSSPTPGEIPHLQWSPNVVTGSNPRTTGRWLISTKDQGRPFPHGVLSRPDLVIQRAGGHHPLLLTAYDLRLVAAPLGSWLSPVN